MFPLFKGATRPAMILGVPVNAAFAAFVGVAVLAVGFSMKLWLLLIPVWFVLAQIAKKDDQMFRILALWIDSKMRYPPALKKLWGACSYAVFKPRKLKK